MKIDIHGFRKIGFAFFVVIISIILLKLSMIDAGNFERLLIWIGNGYFLSNIGSKIMNKINNKNNDGG